MNEDHPHHPEITSISIEGFKSIRRIRDLPLRPINVLIGANGSGKSNFIGAFSLLQAQRDNTADEYVERSGGADRILHFGSSVTRTVQVGVTFHGSGNRFALSLEVAEDDRLVVTSNVSLGDRMMIREGSTGMAQFLRDQLHRFRPYHFHDTSLTSPMKRTADLHDNRYLREDGSNLAAFLYRLAQKEQASYDMIVRTVRLVAPFFDDFVLEPQALNEDKIRLEWRHRGSDAYFDAASLSDGSLRFMALATLLLQPADLQSSVILLDEPELGLHPYAITVFCSLVKQCSVDKQIVLATQSPLIVDHFEPEDVLVADRVAGRTEIRRLEQDRLAEWLLDYSLGELWQKNEFGGRPLPEEIGQDPAG